MMLPVFLFVLCFGWMAPLARAAEPPASGTGCSKADYARTRQRFQEHYRASRYTEAVSTLRRAKEACWGVLDAKDRGWLVSDLGLAELRAGHPDVCLQVLDEAPKELEPQSRVAKAIAFNRGLCKESPSQGGELPVQVMPTLELSSPAEAAAALSREWRHPYVLREGKLPRRRARELRRCTDLEGVGEEDVELTSDPAAYAFQRKTIECRVLRMVTRASPSRVSHVRDVLTMKMPGGVLPAALAPALFEADIERVARAGRAGKSWSELDEGLRFEAEPGTMQRRELEVRGKEDAGYLQWWATGDFNADGVEDVIVFRSMSPIGGSAADLAAFVLTRSQPVGVLEVLERLE